MGRLMAGLAAGLLLAGTGWALPQGYVVWSHGQANDESTRKIYRMTLPNKTDKRALTAGEDIECQVSFDGKWVAYAKAILTGGSGYHSFNIWDIYVVHIDGVSAGHKEIKIDKGYWPTWGKGGVLYYNQTDGTHTRIMQVSIDGSGQPSGKKLLVSTKATFNAYIEINECAVSPDGTWFAGRTRGHTSYTGVGAYLLSPPTWTLLGNAGSVGCFPYTAPDGKWGLHAGSTHGIRWGDAPDIPNRKQDQLLIPAHAGKKAYHPGISTDQQWVMAGHADLTGQDKGNWEIYVYKLDPTTKTVSGEQKLLAGEFNGWPHIWVGATTGPGSDGGATQDAGVAADAAPQPLKILFPAAGAPLVEGKPVALKGQGSGALSWSYDANSDGKGPIDIGAGASTSLTVPTGINPPKLMILTLAGGGQTASQEHPIVASGENPDAGLSPDLPLSGDVGAGDPMDLGAPPDKNPARDAGMQTGAGPSLSSSWCAASPEPGTAGWLLVCLVLLPLLRRRRSRR